MRSLYPHHMDRIEQSSHDNYFKVGRQHKKMRSREDDDLYLLPKYEIIQIPQSNTGCINPIQYGLFLKHYGMGEGAIMAPTCNFAVSGGRRTKFGSLGYFDVPSSKMALIFKFRASMTSL